MKCICDRRGFGDRKANGLTRKSSRGSGCDRDLGKKIQYLLVADEKWAYADRRQCFIEVSVRATSGRAVSARATERSDGCIPANSST